VHAGKLEQVTNFTIVDGTAKHCVDQYMVLFSYCSLGGDTSAPGGLNAGLCHAFLVSSVLIRSLVPTEKNRRHNRGWATCELQ